jgi:hypothetical protein
MEKACHEFSFLIRINYYHPYRRAPHAVDHDDPKFSDPGDDEDIDFTVFVRDRENKLIEVTEAWVYDALQEKAFEIAREQQGE